MKYDIPYNRSQLSFAVSKISVVFKGEISNIPAVTNLSRALLDDLENPIGIPPLKFLTRGRKNIIFLMEDAARRTPFRKVVPAGPRNFNNHGVPGVAMSFLSTQAYTGNLSYQDRKTE